MVEFFKTRKFLTTISIIAVLAILSGIGLVVYQKSNYNAQVINNQQLNFESEISQIDSLTTQLLIKSREYSTSAIENKSILEQEIQRIAKARLDLLIKLSESDAQNLEIQQVSGPTNIGISLLKDLIMPVELQDTLRSYLPTSITSLFEKSTIKEGVLTVLVSDSPKIGKARYSYYLSDDSNTELSKQTKLAFEPADISRVSGDVVRISGVDLAGKTTVIFGSTNEDIEANLIVLKAAIAERPIEPEVSNPAVLAAETRKIAVVMVRFLDQAEPFPYTLDQMRGAFFTEQYSVKEYYKAVTQGEQLLVGRDNTNGDFFGPYTLGLVKPRVANDCGETLLSKLILYSERAALERGDNLSGYRNTVYVFPYFLDMDGICPGAQLGQAYINGRSSWVVADPGRGDIRDFANSAIHELGHNFGLQHASSYKCYRLSDPRTLIPYTTPSLTNGIKCEAVEYGDSYDVMGNELTNYHHPFFSNFSRIKHGWLTGTTQRTIDSSGRYVISPANLPESGEARTLVIPSSIGGVPYTFEYRVRTTVENISPGDHPYHQIIIRRGSPRPYLIRTIPSPNVNEIGLALPVGKTYELEGVFRVRNISADDRTATVEITLLNDSTNPGNCLNQPHELNYSSKYRTASQQFDLHLLRLRNRDIGNRCSGYNFTVSHTGLPNGWKGGFQEGTTKSTSVNISPASLANIPLQINSTGTSLPGRYKIGITTVRNVGSQLEKKSWIVNHWIW